MLDKVAGLLQEEEEAQVVAQMEMRRLVQLKDLRLSGLRVKAEGLCMETIILQHQWQ